MSVKRIAWFFLLVFLISLIPGCAAKKADPERIVTQRIREYAKENPLTIAFPARYGSEPLIWQTERNMVFGLPYREEGFWKMDYSGREEDLSWIQEHLTEGCGVPIEFRQIADPFSDIHDAWIRDVKETDFYPCLQEKERESPGTVSVVSEGFLRLKLPESHRRIFRAGPIEENSNVIHFTCHFEKEAGETEEMSRWFPGKVLELIPLPEQAEAAADVTAIPEMKKKSPALTFRRIVTEEDQGYTAFLLESGLKKDVDLKEVVLLRKKGNDWERVPKAAYHGNDLTEKRLSAGGTFYEIVYFEFYQIETSGTYRVLIDGTDGQMTWYDFKLESNR